LSQAVDLALRSLPFLADGLRVTLVVSGLVVVLSLALGLALGAALTSDLRPSGGPSASSAT
jgi:ABC-type amino acid transport system permease subunit